MVRDVVISVDWGGSRVCVCVWGGGGGRCIPPPAILKHVFDEYNFSIISNLFNNNKPHAQSTNNRKCMNKMDYI